MPWGILLLVVPVAIAASCAFMLPVATPPNAIAVSTGEIRIREMAGAGLWLNLIAIVLVSISAMFLVSAVL